MVSAASGLVCVNVATVSLPLTLTDPATLFPPGFFSVNDTVLGTTGSENVAVGAVETGSLALLVTTNGIWFAPAVPSVR